MLLVAGFSRLVMADTPTDSGRMPVSANDDVTTATSGTHVPLGLQSLAQAGPYALLPTAMNAAGQIVGNYSDAKGLIHAFLRDPDGAVITIDPPGAGEVGTRATGINPGGTVVGFYEDVATQVYRSFLRAPDGTMTIFDVPGAGATPFAGTTSLAVSPSGTVTGFISQSLAGRTKYLCFSRRADGTATLFDPSPTLGFQTGYAIAPDGTITGYSLGGGHAFVRTNHGEIVDIDPPGSTGALGLAIDPAGTVAGSYADAFDNQHAYVRTARGELTTIDPPGALSAFADAISASGVVAGSFVDEDHVVHGFLWTRHGSFTTFDVPGAIGTDAIAINPSGDVVGTYSDAGLEFHGFLRRHDGSLITLEWPSPAPARPEVIGRVAEELGRDRAQPALSLARRGPGGRVEIEYNLPRTSAVSLGVFDLAGRRVASLDSGARYAGHYVEHWDARGATPGVYFLLLRAGGASVTREIVLR